LRNTRIPKEQKIVLGNLLSDWNEKFDYIINKKSLEVESKIPDIQKKK